MIQKNPSLLRENLNKWHTLNDFRTFGRSEKRPMQPRDAAKPAMIQKNIIKTQALEARSITFRRSAMCINKIWCSIVNRRNESCACSAFINTRRTTRTIKSIKSKKHFAQYKMRTKSSSRKPRRKWSRSTNVSLFVRQIKAKSSKLLKFTNSLSTKNLKNSKLWSKTREQKH